MALCTVCKAIRISDIPEINVRDGSGGMIHSTWSVLLQSAESCPLCSLIKWSLDRSIQSEFPEKERHHFVRRMEDELNKMPSEPVLLGPIRRTDDSDSAVIGLKTGIRGPYGLRYGGFFHLFALKGM
jgi:hypothetical protein